MPRPLHGVWHFVSRGAKAANVARTVVLSSRLLPETVGALGPGRCSWMFLVLNGSFE